MAAYRHPGLAGTGRLRLVGDTLLAAGGNALQLLDLAPVSPYNHEPVPLPAQLRNPDGILSGAFDYLPVQRLLAMAGNDGVIALWRMPRPALLAPRAAPLALADLDFDGRHVLAVDGHRVQVVDVDSGVARGPALLHPQPVRLAERSADGRTLFTVAGRSLRVFDAASGALRGEPMLLPQTPLRALLARDADRLLLTTLEYVGEQPFERLHLIDLARGRALASGLRLPAFTDMLELDPRGRFLLYSRPARDGARAAIALHRLDGAAPACAGLALGPGEWSWRTALAADGDSAWSHVSGTAHRGLLLHWDTRDCRVLLRLPMPHGAGDGAPRAWGKGVAFNRLTADTLSLFGPDGARRDVPGMAGWQTVEDFALSRDGRRAALAGRNAVQLFDLTRGERASAALVAPIAGDDAIVQLAFAPDGRRVLARTLTRRWLMWDVPGTDESAADLAALAPVFDPGNADPELDEAGFQALRARLRARLAPPRANPAAAPAQVALAPLPGEAAEARFLPLDLATAINMSLDGGMLLALETPGRVPTLAPGPQRLNGVDWRVDGVVFLNGGGAATHFGPFNPATREFPLPAGPWRRVHVLMRINVPISPTAPPKVAARVRLVGRDGREHALDILTRRHLVTSGWAMEPLLEPGARIAWGVSDAELFAVALDLPPDAGPLRGLRLEVGDGPMEAPLIYAVTLERANASR